MSPRYESTSSDDSSSESSDDGSDSSEYHEAREKLPDSTNQLQRITVNKTSQPQEESTSVPQQTAIKIPAMTHLEDTKLPENAHHSPATDSVERKCASHTSTINSTSTPQAKDSASSVDQIADKHTVTQEITSTSRNTECAPITIKCSSICITKSAEVNALSQMSTTSCQPESKAAPESVKQESSKPVR